MSWRNAASTGRTPVAHAGGRLAPPLHPQPGGFEGLLPAVLLDEPLLARDLAPRGELHHRSAGCELGLHAAAAPVADEVASHREAIAAVDQPVDRPPPGIEGVVDLAVERPDPLASAKAARNAHAVHAMHPDLRAGL